MQLQNSFKSISPKATAAQLQIAADGAVAKKNSSQRRQKAQPLHR